MLDLQQSSDAELEALLASEIGDRKKALAAEILRRRQEAKVQKWSGGNVLLAGLLGPSSQPICPEAVAQQDVVEEDRSLFVLPSVLGQRRTFSPSITMSAKCHERKWNRESAGAKMQDCVQMGEEAPR